MTATAHVCLQPNGKFQGDRNQTRLGPSTMINRKRSKMLQFHFQEKQLKINNNNDKMVMIQN